MAGNKIKFEMTLKELTFKFEGDYEQGQKLQLGINKTLTDLSHLQSAAAGFEQAKEPKLIEATSTPSRSVRRRRKKADNAGSGDADGAAAGGEAATDGDVGDSQRRSSGVSPTQLLLDLKTSGFFAEGKTVAQMVAQMQRTGHTSMRDSDLSSPLLKLCQRQVLLRDKPEGSPSWVYTAGPKDE